jgi:hypothetical protein
MIRKIWDALFGKPKILREADPEWWAAESHHVISIALERFAYRNPDHPFSERIRRELCLKS